MRMPETLLPSGNPVGKYGNLHAGVIMGNERKTERKTRKTLMGLCFFLVEGWTRESCWRGGGGGGGAEDVDGEVSVSALGLSLGLGSPINGG